MADVSPVAGVAETVRRTARDGGNVSHSGVARPGNPLGNGPISPGRSIYRTFSLKRATFWEYRLPLPIPRWALCAERSAQTRGKPATNRSEGATSGGAARLYPVERTLTQ